MSKKAPMKKAVEPDINKQKDFVTNKLLSVFTLAFIMVFALMFIGRRMRRADVYYTAFFKAMSVVAIIFAVLMIAGIVYAIIAKKKGIDTRYKLFSGVNIAVVSGFIALIFTALSASYTTETLKLMYVVIAAVTLLYIIFHSYPREYFTVAASAGIGAVGVWLVCNALNGGVGQTIYPLLSAIIFVLEAALIVWTAIVQKNAGKCGKFTVYAEDAIYWVIYLAAALVIAALALALVLGGLGMYYYTFALLGYVILVGIVFTVKMI